MTDADGTFRRCLPVAEWPEPDRTAWAAAHHRGGLLDEDGQAAAWADATNSVVAGGYGRFLSFLAQTGELDPHQSPATRINRARVEAYLAELRDRNHSSTVAGRLLQLVRAAAVMAPDTDWRWLRRIRARVHRMATPARDDRMRLVPATAVLDLSLQLMERAETKAALSPRQRALLFRDGLMIGILSACPVRARNVAAMSIGTSVQRRGEEWWVAFGAEDTRIGDPSRSPCRLASPPASKDILPITGRNWCVVRRHRSPAMHCGSAMPGSRLLRKKSANASARSQNGSSAATSTRIFLENSFRPNSRSTIPNMSVSLSRCSVTPIIG